MRREFRSPSWGVTAGGWRCSSSIPPVGTALVREAFAAGVTEVVVNEQNLSARGFYEHVGFAVCGRSERDEQGGPFPILYMKLNDNNKPNM